MYKHQTAEVQGCNLDVVFVLSVRKQDPSQRRDQSLDRWSDDTQALVKYDAGTGSCHSPTQTQTCMEALLWQTAARLTVNLQHYLMIFCTCIGLNACKCCVKSVSQSPSDTLLVVITTVSSRSPFNLEVPNTLLICTQDVLCCHNMPQSLFYADKNFLHFMEVMTFCAEFCTSNMT